MRQIGQYAVVCRLAPGELGEIYLARSTEGRDSSGEDSPERSIVVVKTIGLPPSTEGREKFLDSAGGATSFRHRSACRIVEVFAEGREAYVAMELIAGQSLESFFGCRTRGGPSIPSRMILWVIGQLASVLKACSANRIPHRSIAPRHVMLGYDGSVRLLGVGLPPFHGERDALHVVPYTAPEIIRGAEPDDRSRIFSLGVLLYEAFTSLSPFRRSSAQETKEAILQGDFVPPSALGALESEEFEPLLRELLSLEPTGRPFGLEELERKVREIVGEASAQMPVYLAALLSDTFATERSAHIRLVRYALSDAMRAPPEPHTDAGDDIVHTLPTIRTARIVHPHPRPDHDAPTADMQSGSAGEGPIAGGVEPTEHLDVHRVGPYFVRKLLHRTSTSFLMQGETADRKPVLLRVRGPFVQRDRETPVKELDRLFEREGEIARRLEHPSIPRLIDSGREGDVAYLVYPLVRSLSLDRAIAGDDPLPFETKLAFMERLADALDAMHREGFLYCAMKTQAVSVSHDSVWLSDLTQAAPIAGPLHPHLGRDLFALSPEFIEAGVYTQASDQFALGGVYYELLTGTRPFRGLDDQTCRNAIRSKTPHSPNALDSRVNEALSSLVERMLAKKPGERFGSCGEVAALVRKEFQASQGVESSAH